jgi:hypothetical protein
MRTAKSKARWDWNWRSSNNGWYDSNFASGSDPDAVDGNPSTLAVTVISSTEVHMSWVSGSKNEDGFSIERSTDGSAYTVVGNTLSGNLHFHNTGLTPATLYYYRVRAYRNDNTYSGYSNVDSKTTNA